jgi:hypothetical protein
MASGPQEIGEPQRHRVGEHWSGANPVPTVQKFIESLDHEKKERDRRIDGENQAKKEEQRRKKEQESKGEKPDDTQNGDVMTHKPREVSQAKMRTVTDPTTGKDIGVEDQDEDSMDTVKNPRVCASAMLHMIYLID